MKSYLDHIFWDARWIELRHDRGSEFQDRWQTGWFDNPDQLRQAAKSCLDIGNLYTSIHRPFFGNLTGPIRNSDVERFTRLFFDLDSVRETNTAATEIQVVECRQRAQQIRDLLRKIGWPDPLVAESGNGVHLQYRTAVPNTDEWRAIFRTIYLGMAEEFSDALVEFDPVVRNPGRICTLYGSTKRKGTDASLWRQSKVWIPDHWRQVSKQQIQQLANCYAREEKPVAHSTGNYVNGDGDYSTLDVVSWFAAHNHYRRHGQDNLHFVDCPWSDEHTETSSAGTDTLVYESDGESWPEFYCHHAHCEGRRIKAVMEIWGDADVFCTRQFGGAS